MSGAGSDGVAKLALWLAVVCGFIILEVAGVAFLKIRRERNERIGSQAAGAIVGELIDAMETDAAVALPPPRGVVGRAAREAIIGLIATISGPIRVRLVGLLEANGYVERVMGNLGARNAAVRARCCMLLGGMLSPEANDALIWRLHNDSDVNVRMTAAEALAEIGGAPTAEILLEESKRGFRSHRLCIAISRMGAAVVPGLIVSLRDSNEAVLRLSLDILSDTGEILEDILPIIDLTRHPSPEVRGRAVHLLGVAGAVDCMAHVINMTQDDVWFVRVRALKSMRALGIPDAADLEERYYAALKGLLSDEAWWVRHHAAHTLAASGPSGCKILENAHSIEALGALQLHNLRENTA